MSEYQAYEFYAIGRSLSASEQEKVAALSSHISVASDRAFVEYHYSDFKHDPLQVLDRYFDFLVYSANWGYQLIAFRLDCDAVDVDPISPYLVPGCIDWVEAKHGRILVLELSENLAEITGYDSWDDPLAVRLPHEEFTAFYDDLLRGDLRFLFLFWLQAADASGYADITEHGNSLIPVPPNLGDTTQRLVQLREFIGLDGALYDASLKYSVDAPRLDISDFDPGSYLHLLSGDEIEQAVRDLVQGDPLRVKTDLVRRLRKRSGESAGRSTAFEPRRVRFSTLVGEAEAIKAERERLRREEAERETAAYYSRLEQEERRIWEKAHQLIATKKIKAYDQAVELLFGLRQLYTRCENLEAFYSKTAAIVEQWPRLTGLHERMRSASVIYVDPDKAETVRAVCRIRRFDESHPADHRIDFSILST